MIFVLVLLAAMVIGLIVATIFHLVSSIFAEKAFQKSVEQDPVFASRVAEIGGNARRRSSRMYGPIVELQWLIRRLPISKRFKSALIAGLRQDSRVAQEFYFWKLVSRYTEIE